MFYKTLLFFFFQFFIFGTFEAQKLVNQIVAQVGDNIILWSDIETPTLTASG